MRPEGATNGSSMGTLFLVLADTAREPATWVVLLGTTLLGFDRHAWWWVALAAGIGAVTATYAIMFDAQRAGIKENAWQVWLGKWILIGAWAYVVYGVVRLARRQRRDDQRPTRAQLRRESDSGLS